MDRVWEAFHSALVSIACAGGENERVGAKKETGRGRPVGRQGEGRRRSERGGGRERRRQGEREGYPWKTVSILPFRVWALKGLTM